MDDEVIYDQYDEVASLLQGVAHEINNPLTVIRTNTDNLRKLVSILEEGKDSETETSEDSEESPADTIDRQTARDRARTALQGINEATRRIEDVVNNFRDFVGKGGGETADLDFADLVDSSLSVARYQTESIETVHTELVPGIVIDGNKMQLQQVVLNLLTNAVHAIEERQEDEEGDFEGRIELVLEADGDLGRLSVRDNGSGVPEELRESIFAPYVTTKPQGKGFGVGLSKALGIAREHDGNLYYVDSEGPGSTFVLELPRQNKGGETL